MGGLPAVDITVMIRDEPLAFEQSPQSESGRKEGAVHPGPACATHRRKPNGPQSFTKARNLLLSLMLGPRTETPARAMENHETASETQAVSSAARTLPEHALCARHRGQCPHSSQCLGQGCASGGGRASSGGQGQAALAPKGVSFHGWPWRTRTCLSTEGGPVLQ